eukprot:ctg_1162.g377
MAALWMVGTILVAGFFIPISKMHVWFRWIRYVSFVYYGYNGFIINEFQDSTYACEDNGAGGGGVSEQVVPVMCRVAAATGDVSGDLPCLQRGHDVWHRRLHWHVDHVHGGDAHIRLFESQ